MKKELLFAIAQITEPVTGNTGIDTNSSRTAWHTRPLRLIFSVLLILFVTNSTGRTNYNLPNKINFNVKSLTDVTLLFDNSFYRDFDVWLYNLTLDTFYYINVSPNRSEVPLTVPEGIYDIVIQPNDSGTNSHFYAVGCGYTGSGYGGYTFEGVNITSELYCNYIHLE